MSEFIKKEHAIDAVECTDWYHINKNGTMVHGANDAIHQAWQKADEIHKAIENIPALNIVKCKECRYGEYREDYGDYECHSSGCGLVYRATFFCADGERR